MTIQCYLLSFQDEPRIELEGIPTCAPVLSSIHLSPWSRGQLAASSRTERTRGTVFIIRDAITNPRPPPLQPFHNNLVLLANCLLRPFLLIIIIAGNCFDRLAISFLLKYRLLPPFFFLYFTIKNHNYTTTTTTWLALPQHHWSLWPRFSSHASSQRYQPFGVCLATIRLVLSVRIPLWALVRSPVICTLLWVEMPSISPWTSRKLVLPPVRLVPSSRISVTTGFPISSSELHSKYLFFFFSGRILINL